MKKEIIFINQKWIIKILKVIIKFNLSLIQIYLIEFFYLYLKLNKI